MEKIRITISGRKSVYFKHVALGLLCYSLYMLGLYLDFRVVKWMSFTVIWLIVFKVDVSILQLESERSKSF